MRKWILSHVLALLGWTAAALFRLVDWATEQPAEVAHERPALTRPIVKSMSLSDRMRRKAAADAKRKADRIACQLAAHDFEFREAGEADHVR